MPLSDVVIGNTPLHFSRCVACLIRCEGTPLSFLRRVVGPRLMGAEGEMKKMTIGKEVKDFRRAIFYWGSCSQQFGGQ